MSTEKTNEPLDLTPLVARYRTGTYAIPVGQAVKDCRDMLFEIEELRDKLAKPCGSCHPCVNWAPQTWVNAGRSIPHVHEWDELRDKLGRVLDLMTWDDGEQREDVSVEEILRALGEVQ